MAASKTIINEICFDEIVATGHKMTLGAVAPDLVTYRDPIKLWAFDGNAITEELHFDLTMPHRFKAGTIPAMHVTWSTNLAAQSGNIKWQISLIRASPTQAFGAPVVHTSTQAVGAQYVNTITSPLDMLLSGGNTIMPGTVFHGTVFRDPGDGADTFTGDAFLHHVGIHYRVGQIATRLPNSFASEGF